MLGASEPIHLVCAADARYGGYAGIMISSVLRSNPGHKFHIHCFSDGMRRRDLRKIAALVETAGSRVTLYEIDGRLAEYARHVAGWLTRTAYARLLIGEILPSEVRWVIYLDCDIICTGGLAPFWALRHTVPLVGAVLDRSADFWRPSLGLTNDAEYFNSGVMLVNLEGWRDGDVGRRILDWIEDNPDKRSLADQHAINLCLRGAITPLPDCWNLQIGRNSGPLAPDRLNDAVLLHYAGKHKPWRLEFRDAGKDIFLYHKRTSPWRFKPPDFRIIDRFNKRANRLRERLNNFIFRRRHAALAANSRR